MARHFTDWLAGYLEYTSPSEAPDDCHIWTGVATIAGVLQRKVWIPQGNFEWVPNFYIVLVAEPGIISKSTTISIGMDLLKRVPGVQFGPNVTSWQALVFGLAAAQEEVVIPGMGPIRMSCLTIASSEFGTFLDPTNREMIDALVELWDSKRGVWTKATKTQGTDIIENPWINMIACTTPSWIKSSFPEYMLGGGFVSRCIFVHGEKKRRLVAYPGEEMPLDFEGLGRKLVDDLVQMSMLKGAYKLTGEALAYGKKWYTEHNDNGNGNSEIKTERFKVWHSRKQTHIHKTAMVLAASRRNELVITLEDLQAAEAMVTALEPNMTLLFDQLGRTKEGKQLSDIAQIVQTYGTVHRHVAFRKVRHMMDRRSFALAVDAAIYAGEIMASADLLTYNKNFVVQCRNQNSNPTQGNLSMASSVSTPSGVKESSGS